RAHMMQDSGFRMQIRVLGVILMLAAAQFARAEDLSLLDRRIVAVDRQLSDLDKQYEHEKQLLDASAKKMESGKSTEAQVKSAYVSSDALNRLLLRANQL